MSRNTASNLKGFLLPSIVDVSAALISAGWLTISIDRYPNFSEKSAFLLVIVFCPHSQFFMLGVRAATLLKDYTASSTAIVSVRSSNYISTDIAAANVSW